MDSELNDITLFVRQYRLEYKNLKRLTSKHHRCVLRAEFLNKCVHHQVIPNFLKIRIPRHLQQYSDSLMKGQLKTLRNAQTKAQDELVKLSMALETLHLNIASEIGNTAFDKLVAQVDDALKFMLDNMHATENKKLAMLINTKAAKQLPSETMGTNTVLNLSSHTLKKMRLKP